MDLEKLHRFSEITDEQMELIAELLAEKADEALIRSRDAAISGDAHKATVEAVSSIIYQEAAGEIAWARKDHEHEEEE